MSGLQQFAGLVNASLLVASACGWLMLGLRRRGRPWIAPTARRPAPWGILETILVILVSLVVPLLFALAWLAFRGVSPAEYEALLKDGADSGFPPLQVEMMVVDGTARLISIVVAAALIAIRLRPTAADWGISVSALRDDLTISIVAFVLIVPPVLLLKWLLLQTFPDQLEEAHPLIQRVRAHPDSLQIFAVTAFSAVLVAPLFEEFLFRLILQGGFERWATTGSPFSDPGSRMEPSPPTRFWPVWASSAIFAAMHLGHGIDPVPLFILALGLGYLYRQTHRLGPPILVHGMLNCLTMAQLLVEVISKQV
ncbi:MAG: hypothetical protein RIS70_3579 [Planctomycetota bacterium]